MNKDWRDTPITVGSRIVYSGIGTRMLEAEVTSLDQWPRKVTAMVVGPANVVESRKRFGPQRHSTIPGERVTVVA